MVMIINFTFSFANVCIMVCFLNKVMALGILLSTPINAELVAKPLILGIILSISVMLELEPVFLTKLLV